MERIALEDRLESLGRKLKIQATCCQNLINKKSVQHIKGTSLPCTQRRVVGFIGFRYGSRTTTRRDFNPKGLQAEIKTLQAPQNAILSSAKCCFSKILASLVHSKRYS